VKKFTVAYLSLLLLSAGWIPTSYASPTSKKISVSCDSSVSDSITGQAIVMVCEASSAGPCTGSTLNCPVPTCDSQTTSMTVVCDPGFKIDAVQSQIVVDDNTSTMHLVEGLKGKGFSESFGFLGDTVTVTVK
jgi:hypothetical protein